MKRIKIFLIGTLSIMVIMPIGWYSSQFYWQSKTKNLYKQAQASYQKKYVYITFRGALDQAMYADDEKGGKKLANYYKRVSDYNRKLRSGMIEKQMEIVSGDTLYSESIFIPVPLQHIGVEEPIYVEEIDEADSVVKAYVFNTSCWGYFEAYLAKSTVHDKLPPDSLLEEFIDHVHSLPTLEGNTFGQPSPYGFYCN